MTTEIEARFDAVGIVVPDIAAAVAFYRLLGLEFPTGTDEEARHVEAPLPGGLRLMIDSESSVREFDPGFDPAPGSGRIALAFECGNPAAVDALYAAITAAGHPGKVPPFDAPWGQRYATVLDPAGNGVDLFAAR